MRNTTGYIKYLTDEEYYLYKKEIGLTKNPSMRMVLKMLILGLRVGEIVTLKRNNFTKDFSIVEYTLLKSKSNQNGNGRIHSRKIPQKLAEDLQLFNFAYSRTRIRWKTEYFFFPYRRSSQGINRPLHIQTSTIRDWFHKFRKKFNFDRPYHKVKINGIDRPYYRISPHTIRHYFAYKFFLQCNDIIKTSMVLGHKRTETTERYIKSQVMLNDERNVVEKLGLF